MTKYVYLVYQVDLEPWENYHDGIHKAFPTEGAAIAYVKDNEGKVFPEHKESCDKGWCISSWVRKVVLEG